MPSIGEWFGVYSSLRDNVGATAAATQAVRAQLESLRADIIADLSYQNKGVAQYLSEMITGAGAGADPNLLLINDTLKQLSDQGLLPLIASFVKVDGTIASSVGQLQGVFEVFLADMDLMLKNISTGVQDSAKAQQEIAKRVTKLIDVLFAEHSPSAITIILSAITTIGPVLLKILPAIPFFFSVFERLLPENWSKNIIESLGSYGDLAKQAGGMIMSVIEAPMATLVEESQKNLLTMFMGHAPAQIDAPTEAATEAILMGNRFGLAAHGLAAAVEMVSPLKYLGMGQVAAYLVDLAGFKPIAQAVAGAMVGGAITRPMRWWGNAVFQPEIPGVGDLERLVQKRVIDEQTYIGYLAYHGFPREIADYFAQTVYRDFSIRDIALAMEDTTIDPSWLEPRIMRIGYDDDDAAQITKSLIQRGAKTARFRVMSAAYSAVSSGSISIDDYRTILQGLDLRQTTIDYEVQAATIASHNDYIKDSIAVYRKQYVNGVIDDGSFRVALAALGLPSERIELVAADAWAQIAPRIAREERAQIEDTMREVQRYLVPAYRELMELGLISDDQYVQALIDAGVSQQVAQQSAILARMRINAVATRTRNKAAERELAQLYDEREELYVEMYRREQITEGGLASSLAALGINSQRVAAIVDTERTRKIPPISRPPKPPADAKERYIRDLAIQAAVAAFRTGKISEGALKQALITNLMSAEEADATVQLEVARKR